MGELTYLSEADLFKNHKPQEEDHGFNCKYKIVFVVVDSDSELDISLLDNVMPQCNITNINSQYPKRTYDDISPYHQHHILYLAADIAKYYLSQLLYLLCIYHICSGN